MRRIYPNLSDFENQSEERASDQHQNDQRTEYFTANETEYGSFAASGPSYGSFQHGIAAQSTPMRELDDNARALDEIIRRNELERIREEAQRNYEQARALRVREQMRPLAGAAAIQNYREMEGEMRGLAGIGEQLIGSGNGRALFSAANKQRSYRPYNETAAGQASFGNGPMVVYVGGRKEAEKSGKQAWTGEEEGFPHGRSLNNKRHLDVSLEDYPLDIKYENVNTEEKKKIEKECKSFQVKRLSEEEIKVKTSKNSYRTNLEELIPYLRLVSKEKALLAIKPQAEDIYRIVMDLKPQELVYYFKISHKLPTALDPRMSPASSFTNLLDIDKAMKAERKNTQPSAPPPTWSDVMTKEMNSWKEWAGGPTTPHQQEGAESRRPPPYEDERKLDPASGMLESTGAIPRAMPASRGVPVQPKSTWAPAVNETPEVTVSRASSQGAEEELARNSQVETCYIPSSRFRRSIVLQMGIFYLILDHMRTCVRHIMPLDVVKNMLRMAWANPEGSEESEITREETWNHIKTMADEELEYLIDTVGFQKMQIPAKELYSGPRGEPLRRIHAGAGGDDSDKDRGGGDDTGKRGPGTQESMDTNGPGTQTAQGGQGHVATIRSAIEEQEQFYSPINSDNRSKRKRAEENLDPAQPFEDLTRMFYMEYAKIDQTVSGSKIPRDLKAETKIQLGKMKALFQEVCKRYKEDRTAAEPISEGLEETIEASINRHIQRAANEIIGAVTPVMERIVREEVSKATKKTPQDVSSAVRGLIRKEMPKLVANEKEQGQAYADKLKIPGLSVQNVQSTPRPAGNVITIRQAGELRDKTPERICQDFRAAFDPRTEQLQLKAVRPGRGGLIVVAESKEQVQKIKNNKALQEAGLMVEEVKNRAPHLLLREVDTDLAEEKLQEGLYVQNPGLSEGGKLPLEQFKKNFRPVRKYEPRGKRGIKGKCNWVVECSPQVRNLVMKEKRFFLDYGVVRCEDYLVPSRCYKCHSYNHVAKYCKAKDSTCGYCATEGHKYAECPEKEKDGSKPTCAACKKIGEKETEHSVEARECEAFQRAREALIRNTDYGL